VSGTIGYLHREEDDVCRWTSMREYCTSDEERVSVAGRLHAGDDVVQRWRIGSSCKNFISK